MKRPGERYEIRKHHRSYRLRVGICPQDDCEHPPSLGDDLSVDVPGACLCGTAPVVILLSKAIGVFVPVAAAQAGTRYVYACTKRGTHCCPIRLPEQTPVSPACAHGNGMHLVLIPVST